MNSWCVVDGGHGRYIVFANGRTGERAISLARRSPIGKMTLWLSVSRLAPTVGQEGSRTLLRI